MPLHLFQLNFCLTLLEMTCYGRDACNLKRIVAHMKNRQVKSTGGGKQGNLDDLGERAARLIDTLAPPSIPQRQRHPDNCVVSLQDILEQCDFPPIDATPEEKKTHT